MLLGENILTLSLYLYRKKTYSSNLLLLKYDTDMKREPVYIRIYHFYLEGFREMKLGKTLWLIILVKLFYQRSCAVLISFFIKRSCRPFVISAQPSSIQRGSLQQACSHSLNCSMSSRAFSGSEDKRSCISSRS